MYNNLDGIDMCKACQNNDCQNKFSTGHDKANGKGEEVEKSWRESIDGEIRNIAIDLNQNLWTDRQKHQTRLVKTL